MRGRFPLLGLSSVKGWLAIGLIGSLILISGCVPNERPVAQITAKPTKGEAPLTVYFDGLDSYDPDGQVTSYYWDFGDGVTCPPDCGSGDITAPTHQYMEAGTYKARLTVTDDKGAKDSDFVIIEVMAPGTTPPETILFFDDFEDGPDPAWGPAVGDWVVREGKYQLRDWHGKGRTYVRTGLSWRNYAVEVTIRGGNREEVHWLEPDVPQRCGIIIRAQDDENRVMLVSIGSAEPGGGNLCWYVIKDGKTKKGCVKKAPGLPKKKALVRVAVFGNHYEAYVNGIKVTEMEDDTFERGMPGLSVRYNLGVTFDDFKVISLGD